MKARPKGYPYHTLIETYRSWGEDPELEACLSGRRPGGLVDFVRLVLKLKKLEVCERTGDSGRGFPLCLEALSEARDAGLPLGRAEALQYLAMMHAGRSELDQMREAAEQALELFSAHGNPRGRADALHNLGYVHDLLGDFEKARACYEQSANLSETSGDKRGAAMSLNNLSSFYAYQGDLPAALRLSERAFHLAGEVEDPYTQSYCLTTIGAIRFRLGDARSALTHQERALVLQQEVGDLQGQATALRNIGEYEAFFGNYPRALACYTRSLELYRALGDRTGKACVLTNLGKAQESLGDYSQAALCLERALAIQRETGERRNQAFSWILPLNACLGQGDRARAQKALEAAQALAGETSGDQELLSLLSMGAAAFALETHDLEKTRQEIRRGLLLAEALGSKRRRAGLLFLRARLKDEQGDWRDAATDFTESTSLFGSLEEKAELAKVSYYFGKALLTHGEKEKGDWYLVEARRLWEAIGAKGWLAKLEGLQP